MQSIFKKVAEYFGDVLIHYVEL